MAAHSSSAITRFRCLRFIMGVLDHEVRFCGACRISEGWINATKWSALAPSLTTFSNDHSLSISYEEALEP